MEGLSYEIWGLLLAAASLVIACLGYRYSRKAKTSDARVAARDEAAGAEARAKALTKRVAHLRLQNDAHFADGGFPVSSMMGLERMDFARMEQAAAEIERRARDIHMRWHRDSDSEIELARSDLRRLNLRLDGIDAEIDAKFDAIDRADRRKTQSNEQARDLAGRSSLPGERRRAGGGARPRLGGDQAGPCARNDDDGADCAPDDLKS